MSILGKLETSETRLESSESTMEWTIENFSGINAALGVKCISPVFATTFGRKKITWQLEIYPGGSDEENKEYIGLFLRYLGNCEVSVCYKLSILNEKRRAIREFSETCTFKTNECWGVINLISKAVIFNGKTLSNDKLRICCTVKSTLANSEQYSEEDDEQNDARAHFQHLLESGELSDVTFEIENKQMRLHKAIITSLSPVFLAMFRHDMKEKGESVVQITDVKYEVLKELFRYIYVRDTPNMESMVNDLFLAADKYAIRGLKAICEKRIWKNVNENNALQYLEFAVKYNTTILKANVTELIMSRLANFVDTREFERMDGRCKDELLRLVARKFKPM